MAAIGKDGVHKVIGFFCDLCGQECEGDKEELNALGCTYLGCNADASVYHQDCIERYLKTIRCEKNRKTGYHCPRGSGKYSRFTESPCPGRVTKSHPIHIRNEQAKKRQKSKPLEPAPPPVRPIKGKGKGKAEVLVKEKRKTVETKSKQGSTAASAQPKDKPKAGGLHVKNVRQEPALKPLPAPQDIKVKVAAKAAAPMDRDQLKDAVYKAKLEIGLKATPPVKVPKAAAARGIIVGQSLREEESTKDARPIRNAAAQPAVSAWQRAAIINSPVVRTSSPVPLASNTDPFQAELLSSPSQAYRDSHRQQLQQEARTPGKQSETSAAADNKVEPVQAAASPITPNAIKAFQPQQLPSSQADSDTPLHPSADSHSFCAEDCQESSLDVESICSYADVSDILFAMDHSSDSDADKRTGPQHEASYSVGNETDHSSTEQEPQSFSAAKTLSSSEASDLFSGSSQGSGRNNDFEAQLAADLLNQQFLQAVALQKSLTYAAKYQQLGYSLMPSIAAVNKWGDDLQAALAWLLQSNKDALQGVMHEMPTMDVSEELHLSSCQQGFCVPKEVLQQIVIDAQGSLPVAIGVLHRWSQQPYAQDHDYCTEFKSRSGPCLLQPRISGGGASTGNMSDTSHARHSGGIDISSQQWCIQTQPGVASGGAGQHPDSFKAP